MICSVTKPEILEEEDLTVSHSPDIINDLESLSKSTSALKLAHWELLKQTYGKMGVRWLLHLNLFDLFFTDLIQSCFTSILSDNEQLCIDIIQSLNSVLSDTKSQERVTVTHWVEVENVFNSTSYLWCFLEFMKQFSSHWWTIDNMSDLYLYNKTGVTLCDIAHFRDQS